MKVVQINAVQKTGSTGRTMSEFSDYLVRNGHDSYEVYGVGKKMKDREYIVVNRFGYLVHNFLSKFFGNQGGYSRHATKKLIRWLDEIRPEVVHLRNLYGNFLNYRMLFSYLSRQKDIAVVLTTHDFYFLTGNCPFPKCDQYMTGCRKCRNFKRNKYDWLFIRSKEMFRNKKEMLLSLPRFGIQANSFYSEQLIGKSYLRNCPSQVIYNWIDKSIFYPEEDRTVFGTQSDRPVILAVWAYIEERSARFRTFCSVAREMSEEATFVLVGKNKLSRGKYPYLTILGGTQSVDLLRKYYSSAELMFNPSTTDSFGKVVAECQMCGTPAVVFRSQSLPELVGDGCGEIAEEYSTAAACSAIRKALSNGKAFYRDACLKKASNLYDLETNCGKIMAFYRKLLEK